MHEDVPNSDDDVEARVDCVVSNSETSYISRVKLDPHATSLALAKRTSVLFGQTKTRVSPKLHVAR